MRSTYPSINWLIGMLWFKYAFGSCYSPPCDGVHAKLVLLVSLLALGYEFDSSSSLYWSTSLSLRPPLPIHHWLIVVLSCCLLLLRMRSWSKKHTLLACSLITWMDTNSKPIKHSPHQQQCVASYRILLYLTGHQPYDCCCSNFL